MRLFIETLASKLFCFHFVSILFLLFFAPFFPILLDLLSLANLKEGSWLGEYLCLVSLYQLI